MDNDEALEGGGGHNIPYRFNYFEKNSHIPKINMANIPKIQKALYPHILKVISVSHIPLIQIQKYPVSL